MASRCAEDGSLWLVFQDQEGGGTKEYPCPPGEFVDLGGNEGFGDNVCHSCTQIHTCCVVTGHLAVDTFYDH